MSPTERQRAFRITGIIATILIVGVGLFVLGTPTAASQPTLSEEEAADIATEEINGTVQEIEQEDEGGPVYEVEVRQPNGAISEIEIDGDSGNVVEIEAEGDEEMDEDDEEAELQDEY